MVEKARRKGRVIRMGSRVVLGMMAAVPLALGMSRVSRAINMASPGRENGKDRRRAARKAWRSCQFSKDWRFHEAWTHFTMDSNDFCWAVRAPGVKDDRGHRKQRSPAMAAGLADHVWPMAEWLSFPAVQR